MAKIHYMKDKDGNTIYPVTHADAIIGMENVDIDLSAYQTKTDNNLATQSKDLVGAINELFQSADSGKQLIANAIGEPVSADDTFSAMSSDINGLLATFKTNMMNNGIAVGANDKFKQLIDKISTMTEEGQGKGIQFVQGEHVLTEILYTYSANITINTNLSFDPSYVIVYIPNLTPANTGYSNQPDVAITTDCRRMEIAAWYGSQYEYRGPSFELSYTRDTINIKVSRGVSGYNPYMPAGTAIKWYAIGVGEEDTTLRDSLASILQEEGVTTTEEEDMASLITKVDQEFTNKNNQINSSVYERVPVYVEYLYNNADSISVNNVFGDYVLMLDVPVVNDGGYSVKTTFRTSTYDSYSNARLKVTYEQNGEEIFMKEIDSYTEAEFRDYSTEILNAKVGGNIRFYMKATRYTTSSKTCVLKNTMVYCNFKPAGV